MAREYDKVVFTVTLILVGLGIVMIYSASAIRAQERFEDPYFFLKRQALWALVGLTAMVWAMGQDYRRMARIAPWVYLLGVLLLVVVLVPGIGVKVNGARRWLRLGGLSFQPAELAKLALIMLLARGLARKGRRIREWTHGLLPPLGLAGVVIGLVALQPNYGTAILILAVTLTLLFIAGARLGHVALSGLVLLPPLGVLLASAPHVRDRLLALLAPERVSPRILYQITQSQVALGQGGSLGTGLGEGKQKLFYLPEPHTDFIYAIVGEEMGFAGCIAILGFFVLLLWRGARIAMRAPDTFGVYLGLGITLSIVLQAAVNIGMVVGVLPTTGLPLPFLSFGGSSLVFSLLGMGMLLSISRQPPGYPGYARVRGHP